MSTMVQQIQELPEAIKPSAAPSASFGDDSNPQQPVLQHLAESSFDDSLQR